MKAFEQIKVQLNPDSLPSGSDLTAVNAARKSFGKRSDWEWRSWEELDETKEDFSDYQFVGGAFRRLKPQDKRLIEFLARGMTAKDFEEVKYNLVTPCQDMYLQEKSLVESLWKWRNTPTHDTPFNHCFISFEIKAPIFVARQLVKTEYTLISEYSRRYITDDVEFYIHDYREAVKDKKQGSGGIVLDNEYWQRQARISNERQLELYNVMITSGVAPEQARGVLPLDLMTSWTWSGTLGAMAKMCRERLGSDAQKETAYVASMVYGYLKEYYPVSAKALVEGV